MYIWYFEVFFFCFAEMVPTTAQSHDARSIILVSINAFSGTHPRTHILHERDRGEPEHSSDLISKYSHSGTFFSFYLFFVSAVDYLNSSETLIAE